MLLLAQFEQLRNNGGDPLSLGGDSQFMPGPKVLYWWGTGAAPLEWYVSKCEFVHKQGWVNGMGRPQYSDIEMELTLDERSDLYKMEDMVRRSAAITGQITGIAGVVGDAAAAAGMGRPPY